ncbi:MAG: 5'-3' exonuclease H3TH domain-containing protein [Patescibacteria group bacterium]
MKKLVLLDANHLMHRAYWAIDRRLKTTRGEQVNAVFGVVSMLLTMLSRERPDLLLACFDEGKETFRHQDHREYKAGRAETPDDFYTQIPRVHEALRAFAIPILSDPKYEADDLIGSAAIRAAKEEWDVLIVTGDRDLFQMADTRICIAVPHKGYTEPHYLDAAGVKEALGVTPAQVPDYKGLTGDASDNLRGVRGIGPKTAVSLIEKFGSLEAIYEHLPEIRFSVKEKLLADKESAFFCKKLARLVTDIILPEGILQASFSPERAAVERFFATLELKTLLRRFQKFLEEDPYAREHFRGEGAENLLLEESLQEPSFAPDGVELVPSSVEGEGREGKKRLTEEQLPLLD